MGKSGQYFLARHFHPAQSSDAEKAAMVPDGSGNYYFAINSRDDADTMARVETLEAMKDRCGKVSSDPIPEPERNVTITDGKSGTTATRPDCGGSRMGAGRPAVKI